VPVAAAPAYGTLLSSSYARVPGSLLGTAAPAGGAGASLIAPTAYDPGLLLSGTPGRTLAPAGAAGGVTTTSHTGPVLTPIGGNRLGTPPAARGARRVHGGRPWRAAQRAASQSPTHGLTRNRIVQADRQVGRRRRPPRWGPRRPGGCAAA